MMTYLNYILFIFLLTLSCNQKGDPSLKKALVISGGHEFEMSFYEIFDSMQEISFDTISQPGFNEKINSKMADEYSAFIFYDMWQDINSEQQQAYLDLLEKGQGMVFLHHSLVSYQKWDEFIKIIGGKYILPEYSDDSDVKGSTYSHDITLQIEIADKNHPVTKDINDFSIIDEGYQYIEMLSSIHPLLTTRHSECTRTIAWTHTYKNARIVYILLGHDHKAHQNPHYRKLIKNSIEWVSESKEL